MSKDLAHFGVEDAVGSAIVGSERGSSARLWVAKFFEGGQDWASMFAANAHSSGFGFGGRGDDIFDSLAEDVDGTVDAVAVVPTEVAMSRSSAACFGWDKASSVGGCLEDHVAGVAADDGVWMGVDAIHEHVSFCNCVCCRDGLFGGDFIECWEDAMFNTAATMAESPVDGLN
jgi:hypothetical protein